jgi:hypothetical protein
VTLPMRIDPWDGCAAKMTKAGKRTVHRLCFFMMSPPY